MAIDNLRRIPPDNCPAARVYTSGAPRPTATAIACDTALTCAFGSPLRRANNSIWRCTLISLQMTSNCGQLPSLSKTAVRSELMS
eukprot:scaffold66313_cov50-Attheya_sp.AAC.7